MAKINKENISTIDVLILHGMDIELVDDIKVFFKSLELDAETVLNLSSNGKTQNDRVNYQIKNCGIPIALLTFDEQEKNGTKARLNLYDEITRCQTFRPKDTLVLRETRANIRVDLPSNVEGKLVIIEFDRNKLHKLFPLLITELKGRGILGKKSTSEFKEKMSLGMSLSKFLDQMDNIWEQEFDIASDKIDRNDWFTENKFQVTLDKFFLQYWEVFNAIIRDKKTNGELKAICETALSNSLGFASEVWETVADAKMKTVEDIKFRKSKDKKFDSQTYEKYFQLADIDIRDGKRKHSAATKKIQCFRNAVESLNTLIRKVGI